MRRSGGSACHRDAAVGARDGGRSARRRVEGVVSQLFVAALGLAVATATISAVPGGAQAAAPSVAPVTSTGAPPNGARFLAVAASALGPVVIEADGQTTPTLRTLRGLSYIARHPTLPVVYATKELGSGNRVFVALGEAAGSWRELGRATTGQGPVHIAFDSSGRAAFVASYTDGGLTRITLDARGVPAATKRIRLPTGKGPDAARQSGPHAHSSAVSIDDRYVVVADLGTDALHVFDAVSLTLLRTERLPPGTGPRTAVFADAFSLVVSEELRGGVSWWQFADGRLTLLRRISLGPTTPSDVIVRPDSASATGPAVLLISRATDELITVTADGPGRRWATPRCGARVGAWTAEDVVTLACTRGGDLRAVRFGPGPDAEVVTSVVLPGVSSFTVIPEKKSERPLAASG